jgi:hypothetical protein
MYKYSLMCDETCLERLSVFVSCSLDEICFTETDTVGNIGTVLN